MSASLTLGDWLNSLVVKPNHQATFDLFRKALIDEFNASYTMSYIAEGASKKNIIDLFKHISYQPGILNLKSALFTELKKYWDVQNDFVLGTGIRGRGSSNGKSSITKPIINSNTDDTDDLMKKKSVFDDIAKKLIQIKIEDSKLDEIEVGKMNNNSIELNDTEEKKDVENDNKDNVAGEDKSPDANDPNYDDNQRSIAMAREVNQTCWTYIYKSIKSGGFEHIGLLFIIAFLASISTVIYVALCEKYTTCGILAFTIAYFLLLLVFDWKIKNWHEPLHFKASNADLLKMFNRASRKINNQLIKVVLSWTSGVAFAVLFLIIVFFWIWDQNMKFDWKDGICATFICICLLSLDSLLLYHSLLFIKVFAAICEILKLCIETNTRRDVLFPGNKSKKLDKYELEQKMVKLGDLTGLVPGQSFNAPDIRYDEFKGKGTFFVYLRKNKLIYWFTPFFIIITVSLGVFTICMLAWNVSVEGKIKSIKLAARVAAIHCVIFLVMWLYVVLKIRHTYANLNNGINDMYGIILDTDKGENKLEKVLSVVGNDFPFLEKSTIPIGTYTASVGLSAAGSISGFVFALVSDVSHLQ